MHFRQNDKYTRPIDIDDCLSCKISGNTAVACATCDASRKHCEQQQINTLFI